MSTAPELPIRTERLILRVAVDDDVAAVHGYRADPEVCRYLPFSPQSLDDVRAKMAIWRANLAVDPDSDPDADWAITLLAEHDGVVVGDVMLRLRGGSKRSIAEIGYVFDPAHGGKGLATEAARAMVDLGFDHFGCHRVYAHLDPRNTASARVCQRLGMTQEAHLRRDWWDSRTDEFTDSAVYGLLREDRDAGALGG
ncbi:GNAT family N-acetyltransferase [Nocardioides sp. GXZ039]|uniref:GNAT family N-acetyltransferase n=1 Tax=Nocardioides sp. GXZ039 TaxID=3136018 RepID=UPI0030F490A9